jgi:hypothetical protein
MNLRNYEKYFTKENLKFNLDFVNIIYVNFRFKEFNFQCYLNIA